MIRTKNIRWITKYFLLVLIIFHLSFAQDEIELRLENDEEVAWKSPRRHLLSTDYSNMNGTEFVIYIIAVVIITIISICCKYCIKNGCDPTEQDYSDAVVHPPPRRQTTVPVAPSSGRRVLRPPRASGSIILPPEEGVFTVDLTGIENPNYNPLFQTPAPEYYPPTAPHIVTYELDLENPTPILDLPPSYESVMREQEQKFSK